MNFAALCCNSDHCAVALIEWLGHQKLNKKYSYFWIMYATLLNFKMYKGGLFCGKCLLKLTFDELWRQNEQIWRENNSELSTIVLIGVHQRANRISNISPNWIKTLRVSSWQTVIQAGRQWYMQTRTKLVRGSYFTCLLSLQTIKSNNVCDQLNPKETFNQFRVH